MNAFKADVSHRGLPRETVFLQSSDLIPWINSFRATRLRREGEAEQANQNEDDRSVEDLFLRHLSLLDEEGGCDRPGILLPLTMLKPS